jgi:hypothetical protein
MWKDLDARTIELCVEVTLEAIIPVIHQYAEDLKMPYIYVRDHYIRSARGENDERLKEGVIQRVEHMAYVKMLNDLEAL